MKPSHELPKGQHEFVPAQPAPDPLKGTGYVEKPLTFQEYPKHVKNAAGETVTVNSAEEEAALNPVKSEVPADPDEVAPKSKPAPFGKK